MKKYACVKMIIMILAAALLAFYTAGSFASVRASQGAGRESESSQTRKETGKKKLTIRVQEEIGPQELELDDIEENEVPLAAFPFTENREGGLVTVLKDSMPLLMMLAFLLLLWNRHLARRKERLLLKRVLSPEKKETGH